LLDDVETKLYALRKNVDQWLNAYHYGRARYFDPKDIYDLFSRFNSYSNFLRSKYLSYFTDLPIRKVELSGTTDFEGRGYIHRKFLEILLMDIDYCLNVLSKMTTIKAQNMKITHEGVFFSGQVFDAIQPIADIISTASQSIMIVDSYINKKVLSLMTEKSSNVQVRVITKKVSPALRANATEFNKQYGGLYIRTSKEFHDRFVVVDGIDYYHFGASIKDLGNKGFMFSRIEEPEIIKSLSSKLSQEWKKAKPEVEP